MISILKENSIGTGDGVKGDLTEFQVNSNGEKQNEQD